MTDATKQKFLVLFLIPASVMADWAKTDPTIRQAEEQKMQAAWGKWMGEHAKMIISTEAGGKTKRVTASGVSDTKNDIILYSFVEAESHDAAAKAFENHPHLQIPQSSIEIMYVRPMSGM
jgi:DNA invertase Pin-like site-specific DNA recombinase